jgi:hypothetical protein
MNDESPESMSGTPGGPDQAVAALNPWRSIWIRPRATIQQIIETRPEQYVIALSAVAGIFQSLDNSSMRHEGDERTLPAILAMAIIVGPIAGIITLFLFGFLIAWTGRWLGGVANPLQIRAAIAWSSWPGICVGLLWIPELVLGGREMFTTQTPQIDESSGAAAMLFALTLVEFPLGAWALIIFCMCLGQVQGISAWKALGNLLLAGLIMLSPVLVIDLLR